jgi:hypothetical protein
MRPPTRLDNGRDAPASRIATLVALALLLLLALPRRTSLADDGTGVSCDAVRIEALLTPKGDLRVLERWTITCEGTASCLERTIDTTDNDAFGVVVLGAGEVVDGDLRAYGLAEGDERVLGTYRTAGYNSRRTCTLLFEKADETAELYLSFELKGAARRWLDAATITWPFLDVPDAGVGDVTVDLYIERPEDGGTWPQENVFCWRTAEGDTYDVTDITDVDLAHIPHASELRATTGHASCAHVHLGAARQASSLTVVSLFPEEWLHAMRTTRERHRMGTLERMRLFVAETQRRAHEESRLRSLATTAVLLVAVALGLVSLKVVADGGTPRDGAGTDPARGRHGRRHLRS